VGAWAGGVVVLWLGWVEGGGSVEGIGWVEGLGGLRVFCVG